MKYISALLLANIFQNIPCNLLIFYLLHLPGTHSKLHRTSHDGAVDGYFGDATEEAYKAFQKAAGLTHPPDP